ncbi:MAG: hypothetical protein IJX78_02930 [Bacilli bacterium]|nr:hypothetical protein [Bacilli bacterium]
MKKIIKVFLIVFVLLTLSGCGNYKLIDTTYDYHKIHIHNEDQCFNIKSWTDYEGEQLQVELADGTILLVSNINATLIKGECPFCKE